MWLQKLQEFEQAKLLDLPSPVLLEETPESDIQTDDSDNDDCSDSK